MAIHQMNAVWARSKQKGTKLLLLLAIADNADEDGVAWPGISHLAKKTRMSPRQVTRLIGELAKTEELAVVWGGGRGTANLYCVLCDKTDAQIDEIKAEYAAQNEVKNTDNLSVNSAKGDKLSPPINPDKLSKKGDKSGVNPDKLSKKGDKFNGKGDIAMSPDPLNHKEPKEGTDDPAVIWEQSLAELKNQMVRATYDTNLAGSKLAGIHDGDNGNGRVADIVAKDQDAADRINNHLSGVIGRTLSAIAGEPCQIHARPPRLKETQR